MTGVEVPAWSPPWPYRGDQGHLRVSAATLGADLARVCPESLAKKARPQVWPDVDGFTPRPPWDAFWLGWARDAVLALLGSPGSPRVPPDDVDAALAATAGTVERPDPLPAAARTAATGYLDALRRLRGAEPGWDDAVFVRDIVMTTTDDGAASGREAGAVEWFAWGIAVTRDSHAVRELHLLRHRAAGTHPVPEARLAASAWITGDGFVLDPTLRWADRYEPHHAQPPPARRVVVREVGVLDGSVAVLLDTGTATARDLAAQSVPAALAPLAGGARNPGSRCAGCTVRVACPDPVRVPGLLGVAVRAGWTRAVTPGDLTDHAICPHRVHLRRDLGMPRTTVEPHPAAIRGQRVHAWLQAAHGRGIACGPADLPGDAVPGDALPGIVVDLGWSPIEYRAVRPWLWSHLDHCAFPRGDVGVTAEVDVTVWDTDADVVFSTRIDQASYRPGVGRVLRETKTVNPRRLPEDEAELLRCFPQVAFAVVCLATGYDPVDHSRWTPPDGPPGLVELELLDEVDHQVVPFDPSDPDTAMAARVALAEAVDDLLSDADHAPVTGRHCAWCPVAGYCVARSDPAAQPETAPAAAVGNPPPTPPVSILDLVAAATAGDPSDDDEIPF